MEDQRLGTCPLVVRIAEVDRCRSAQRSFLRRSEKEPAGNERGPSSEGFNVRKRGDGLSSETTARASFGAQPLAREALRVRPAPSTFRPVFKLQGAPCSGSSFSEEACWRGSPLSRCFGTDTERRPTKGPSRWKTLQARRVTAFHEVGIEASLGRLGIACMAKAKIARTRQAKKATGVSEVDSECEDETNNLVGREEQ